MKTNRVTVASISVNRSDFGRLEPLYHKLRDSEEFDLRLIVAEPSLNETSDRLIMEVQESGIPVTRVNHAACRQSPLDVHSRLVTRISAFIEAEKPDYFIILGDRFEMLAATIAAFHNAVPIIHIGGGYITRGAMDNQIRDAITALSYHHLVATDSLAARVLDRGVAAENIHVTGAPDIEALVKTPVICREELLAPLGLPADKPFILVTLHPETQILSEAGAKIVQAIPVLMDYPDSILITAPAPDPGATRVREALDRLLQERPDVAFVESLGHKRYVNAMREAAAMFGNSSSGVIESSAIPVPVVNVGSRQSGRETARNVISVPIDVPQMKGALAMAVSPEFRESLANVKSPYGDEQVSERIFTFLKNLTP